MRVGEILLEHGWVDATSLSRAIAERPHTQKRLCSMLIARGLLDPDHASRALGEQHQCAAALQKHLEHRDRSLVDLLPGSLARQHCALPIGRLGTGDLIVCVRDPAMQVLAAIRGATNERIVFAVAPAAQLERLVEQSYSASQSADDWEVDMSTGPLPIVNEFDVDITTGTHELGGGPNDLESSFARIASGQVSLVELDDQNVSKDFSQNPILIPSRTQSNVSGRSALSALAAVSLEESLEAIDGASTRDEATAALMKHVGVRYEASILFTIKEGAALGFRGHGPGLTPEAVAAFTLPLSMPSIVKGAFSTKAVATGGSGAKGAIQTRLEKLLGEPHHPRAVPIVVGSRVACVLAVGDAKNDPTQAANELDRLAEAISLTYTRIVRESKPKR